MYDFSTLLQQQLCLLVGIYSHIEQMLIHTRDKLQNVDAEGISKMFTNVSFSRRSTTTTTVFVWLLEQFEKDCGFG